MLEFDSETELNSVATL